MAYQKEEAEKATDKDEDKKILQEARDYLAECIEEEDSERAKMLDDLRQSALGTRR